MNWRDKDDEELTSEDIDAMIKDGHGVITRGPYPSYLTVDEAEDLAARTLIAMAKKFEPWLEVATPWLAADRERLVSDLDLLRETYISEYIQASLSITIFLRKTASDGLRRTAALYGLSCARNNVS